MDSFFSLPFSENWIQIGLLVLVLIVAWTVLRFVLGLARRLFTLGCGLILFLGVALLVLRYFSS